MTGRRPESDVRVLTDSVGQYLDAIGRYELLTAEQEIALARHMEDGLAAQKRLDASDFKSKAEKRELEQAASEGEVAKQAFVAANLRLVVANARRYVGHSDMDLLDLVQEGNLGLIRAVEKFDWRKGFKFSTYATWWIRQALQRAVAQHSRTIRLPVHLHDILGVVRATRANLASQLGREPTAEEIAAETGLETKAVSQALGVGSIVSIDEPVGEDGAELADFIHDEGAEDPFEATDRALQGRALHDAIARLSDKEAEIVKLRFGLEDGRPWTLAEVGERVGLTPERVRQLAQEALTTIAAEIGDDDLAA
ncbi:MAG: RNA polymerase sigma factor RpoD/SigA [Acidimicrobiia bacterium]